MVGKLKLCYTININSIPLETLIDAFPTNKATPMTTVAFFNYFMKSIVPPHSVVQI